MVDSLERRQPGAWRGPCLEHVKTLRSRDWFAGLPMTLPCALALALGARPAAAQSFHLSSSDIADSAALSRSMPRLAAEVLAVYRDTARARFLDNRFRLQILTGRY